MLEKWQIFFSKIDFELFPKQLVIFAVIVLCGLILSKVAKKITVMILTSVDKKSQKEAFQANLKSFLNPIGNFLILLSVYIGVQILPIPNDPIRVDDGIIKLLVILMMINACRLLYGIGNVGLFYFELHAEKTESKLDDQLVPIFRKLVKILVIVIGIILVLTELGYSVAGLVAGLGIGGLALALAAKETLANIFGSLVIFADKPFQVGDVIKTSKYEGKVEEVGFRSTQLRTSSQTLVYVPNNEISTSVIENTSKIKKRLIQYNLPLSFTTTSYQMEQAVIGIEQILKSHPEVEKADINVVFSDFAPTALTLMVSFYTSKIILADFLKVKENINFMILRKLEELKVQFALPNPQVFIDMAK